MLTPEQERVAESLNPEPTKLTRKYLMGLPRGTFVASNVWREPWVQCIEKAAGGKREACVRAADPKTKFEYFHT